MTISAGVDIGSTASKIVLLQDGRTLAQLIGPSTASPKHTARQIYEQALAQVRLDPSDVACVVGTGYGRTQVEFAGTNVSEITCHGRGAHAMASQVRTVIDIGGQDVKALRIDEHGNLVDFVMNDKCAAGTGRFLDAMARSLGIDFEALEQDFFCANEERRITSMCSVFAESEVISLVNDGVPRPAIVKGLLRSLAGRVATLVRRLGVVEPVLMSGGLAKSRAVVEAVQDKLGIRLLPTGSTDPQLIGALGAALVAQDVARGTVG